MCFLIYPSDKKSNPCCISEFFFAYWNRIAKRPLLTKSEKIQMLVQVIMPTKLSITILRRKKYFMTKTNLIIYKSSGTEGH